MTTDQSSGHKRGFTLVEALFYAAGLLVLLMAMGGFFYYMYDWYRGVTVGPRADRAAVIMVDRIIKDIRTGVAIDEAQSIFGSDVGRLTLDAMVGAALVEKRIELVNGRVAYRENGGTVSYLSPADLTVSRFRVASTTTSVSQGVKFDIDITFTLRAGQETRTYGGFAILRQSYE